MARRCRIPPTNICVLHDPHDRAIAETIARDMRRRNKVQCECESVDSQALEEDGLYYAAVAERMFEFTEYIVVLSEHTASAWWLAVAGTIAGQEDCPMTFFRVDSDLPRYLHRHPVLKTEDELDVYARVAEKLRCLREKERLDSVYGVARNMHQYLQAAIADPKTLLVAWRWKHLEEDEDEEGYDEEVDIEDKGPEETTDQSAASL